MILASQSFSGNIDEFVSTGPFTPATVESQGYSTQSTCGLTLSGTSYTATCYRPFATSNASPGDVKLAVGSTVELGFAVGEFNHPGVHAATTMQSYVLSISSQQTSGSTSSTTITPPPSSSSETFPGLNPDTLYVISAMALLIGIALGIAVSIRARKAAPK